MSFLLSPLTWLLIGLPLVAFGQWKRWSALSLPGIVLMTAAWLGMTPTGANWLVGHIERKALAMPGECAQVEWLVLLAGGLDRAPERKDDGGALTHDSLRRVFALQANPPPANWQYAISGGGPHALAEASVMADLLLRLDPTGAEAVLETTSRTTWESAHAMAALLPPPRRIALASSALHLPRARLAFEAAGFEVCPWPLDRRFIAVSGVTAWIPQSSALRKSEATLHEVVGAQYYRWMAWRGAASSSE